MKPVIMLAEELQENPSKYIASEDWRVEQKFDGHRVMLAWQSGELLATERYGRPSQHHDRLQHPHWRLNFENLGHSRSFIFDGELIDDTYWIFDLLHVTDIITPNEAFEKRRIVLEALFDQNVFNEHLQLVPSMHEKEGKIDLITRCVVEGAEGVIYKDRRAPYTPGRSPTILKQKFTKTADLIVLELGHEGKNNAVLGCYKNGELVEVGRCSLIGKPKVAPGDVVEVKYLYLGKHDRLVQPTLKHMRDDKEPMDCVFGQLQRVNKEPILF